MKPRQLFPFIIRLTAIALLVCISGKAQYGSGNAPRRSEPIIIDAPALANLDFRLSTGGLPAMPARQTYFVLRANREKPEMAEGLGWTYHHHPDIAVWKGRLYVAWNAGERDEDTWPSRELYSSSANGRDWDKPAALFPEGISTPLRMYFFLAPNGRMLVIAGMRVSQENTSERKKSALVVRELLGNHRLGEVFTLRAPAAAASSQPISYTSYGDKGFVEACEALLADHLFLEQQDYGVLLEPQDRMIWHESQLWQGDAALKKDAEDFGKAMCFFSRKDGAIVAIGKKGWTTVSLDKGATWTQPVRPSSLITGNGKVWAQQTSDGRYAMVYSPDLRRRWPLMLVTSEDGITFNHPQVLHEALPEGRYEGLHKDAGLSYPRGLSAWNNDGTWIDDDMWLVCSLNKEDICVIRVPF